MKKIIILALVLLCPLLLSSKKKEDLVQKPDSTIQKEVQAVHTNGSSITLDGILDEDVWQTKGTSDFVQSDPNDGTEPSEKTEVWIAYDDEAIYVAARMHDSEPGEIKSRLGRRDDFSESDWFIFAVDPYYDRRSGYQFAVNPDCCIVDWTIYNDVYEDATWDGVWYCSAAVDETGWNIELKIPYHQLRFPKKDEYVWGVNFQRVIKRKNERIGYVWIPKEDTGYVSRFAKLMGIRGISPGRNIVIMPYTVGQAEFGPEEAGNPFQTGERFLGNTGFDLKIGLLSNLTLDASVNPDFGQVEVDPAVINLSDYETYFSEKRPFFIEGANIFDDFGRGGIQTNLNINWPSPTFFYSRRIGRAPQGDVSQDGYVRFPDRSTILGAFKLTGKLGKGWNFGFINALTAREFAEIDIGGGRIKEEVEPFSYYGILRAQKELNEGHNGFGIITTSVIRDLGYEPLTEILNDRAFGLAIDGFTFLDKDKSWILSGWTGGTHIEGSSERILSLQESSLHYFQRPDADHVVLDPNATSLSGWAGRVQLNKQGGRFWLNSAIGFISPGFDPNDMGFQFGSSDVINMTFVCAYLWPHPGKLFRSVIVAGGPFRNYDFGWNKTWDGMLFLSQGEFLNYWGFEIMLAYNPDTFSNDMTRGGPLVRVPYGYQINAGFNSDNRKAVVFSFFGNMYHRPETDTISYNLDASIRWKPRSNISLSIGPGYYERTNEYQWVRRITDDLMTDTYGNRYVFGRIFQRVLSAEIRINWIFTPKLSLQAYIQPFMAIGEYDRFKELAQPKTTDFNVYGEGDSTVDFADDYYYVDPDGLGPASEFEFYNPDFNFKSLRGTIVLRWEYLPGSTFFFVWTQNRADFSNPGDFRFGRDFGDLLTAPGDNIFLVKLSYRWNL